MSGVELSGVLAHRRSDVNSWSNLSEKLYTLVKFLPVVSDTDPNPTGWNRNRNMRIIITDESEK